jgi:hypothetical protein
MKPDELYDVFVSYSHEDSEWVRDVLLLKLENAGFSVCIDFRDFVSGAFSVEEMQRSVQSSKRTLLVLTPAYVRSEWGRLENIMAQTLDPIAVQRRVIPILRENCNVPLRLSIIHHRDLRSGTDEQWDFLFRDLS